MAFISTIKLPTWPRVTQSVSLEGVSYVFSFDWNSRIDRWSLSISTEDGVGVLSGAPLVLGVDLLRTIPNTLAHVPPGQLYLAGADDPTLETIGAVSLYYVPSE